MSFTVNKKNGNKTVTVIGKDKKECELKIGGDFRKKSKNSSSRKILNVEDLTEKSKNSSSDE